jgi:hypothetical protein
MRRYDEGDILWVTKGPTNFGVDIQRPSHGSADILVCEFGRLSSRPQCRPKKSGDPAGWKACATLFARNRSFQLRDSGL